MNKQHSRDLASKITTLQSSKANIISVTAVKYDLTYFQKIEVLASDPLYFLMNTSDYSITPKNCTDFVLLHLQVRCRLNTSGRLHHS